MPKRRDFLKSSAAGLVAAASRPAPAAGETPAGQAAAGGRRSGPARTSAFCSRAAWCSRSTARSAISKRRRADRGQKIAAVGRESQGRRPDDRRLEHDRHAGVRRYAPPSVRDDPARHSRRRHPERAARATSRTSRASTRRSIGRKTRASRSSSRRSARSTRASRPAWTRRRCRTRRNTPTRASTGCPRPDAARCSPTRRASGAGAQYPQDIRRLRTQYFSSNDQLLTLAMGGGLDRRRGRSRARSARRSSITSSGTPRRWSMGKAGLMGPDNEYIHCTQLTEAAWKMIADTGGKSVDRDRDRDADAARDAADPAGARPRHHGRASAWTSKPTWPPTCSR